MIRGRLSSLVIFLAGFCVHALTALALDGRLSLPLGETPLRIIGIGGLLVAVFAVWRDLAGRDEVVRGFALNACAVSFTATAILAYLGAAPNSNGAVAGHSLWTVALAVWLLCFAFLQWRARW